MIIALATKAIVAHSRPSHMLVDRCTGLQSSRTVGCPFSTSVLFPLLWWIELMRSYLEVHIELIAE